MNIDENLFISVDSERKSTYIMMENDQEVPRKTAGKVPRDGFGTISDRVWS